MPGHQSTIGIETIRKADFLGRLALLRDKQNDFPALVIILSTNSYSYSTEEDATHERIQKQRRSGDGKEI
jgi:hypothetical protein